MSKKEKPKVKTLRLKVELTEESIVKAWKASTYNVEIWNWALNRRKEELGNGKFLSYEEQCKELTQFKKLHPEYSEYSSRTYQLTLDQLESNFKTTWSNKKNNPEKNHHLPGFKSRKYFNTLTFDAGVYFESNRLYGLNKKNNLITFKSPIDIPLEVFNNRCSIVKLSYNRSTKDFYISIPYYVKSKEPLSLVKDTIAFDLGLKTLAVGIDDDKNVLTIVNTVKPIARYFDKSSDLVRSERDKCKKYSKRYKRLSKVMANLQVKKTEQIKVVLCKLSKAVVGMGYKRIIVGDLNIQEMVIKKEESDLPNRVIKNINKAIHQQWYVNRFVNHLEVEVKNTPPSEVLKFNERGTTRTCNNCGFSLIHGLDPKERVYKCLGCGLELDRDTNSSSNIYSRSKGFICGMNPLFKITDVSNLRKATLKVSFNYVGIPNIVFN